MGRHPLDGPWDWKRGVFFALLLVTIVGLAPRVAGPPRCDAVLGSMVALELACQEDAARRELRAWSAASGTEPAEFLGALRRAIVLDVAFLLAYATALALAVLGIGNTLGGRFARAATPLAWLQWLAGLLDLVENGALLQVVGGRTGNPWPLLAAACAALKFALVAAGLLFVIFGSALVLKRLLHREPVEWPTPVLLLTPLGKWLTSYPVLTGTAVLLLAVLYRNALAALGIPDLFWHERFSQQLGAGLGAGLLVADLGLVGFLVEAGRPWMKELGVRIPWLQAQGESARSLFAYLVVTSLPLLLLVLGGVTAAGGVSVWPFLLIVPVGTFGLGALALFLWTRYFRERDPFLIPSLKEASRKVRGPKGVGVGGPRLDGLAWVLLFLRVALLVVIWAVTLEEPSLLPAAFALCLVLSLVASFYGFFITFFPAWRFGVLAVMVVAWVALNSASARRHQIREMEYEGSRPRPGNVHHVSLRDSGLADDADVLRHWQVQRGDVGPLVVLAVDGGGVRAATWVMSVLTQLEEDLPGFAHQVRIVTGASGGMVGAAYWTASLQPPGALPAGHAQDGRLLHRTELIRRISADSLTPLAHRLVLHDLIPFVSRKGRDRGDVIGGVWVDNTEGVLGRRFRELQPGELAGWRPSLVVSPMIVEDGRRLLISNLDLEALATRRTSRRFLSRDAIEHYRLFDDAAELKLVTAVRMSATFPYVMPSVELPTNPLRRTVDAGYYDEHGVDLAATWLLEHAPALASARRVILIEVPDNPAARGKQAPCDARASFWRLGLAGFSTPPEAILSGRDSSAAFRNDQMIETVEQTLDAHGEPGRFRSLAFEPAYDESCDVCGRPEDLVALSWRLTGGEVQRLRDGMLSTESCEKRQKLREWWVEGGGAPPVRPLLGCPTRR